MRDKYIQLIKDYIIHKPEYKQALDKLKRDTMLVGATEDEFEEAIKQLEITPEEIAVSNSNQNNIPANKPKRVLNMKKTIAFSSLLLITLISGILIFNNYEQNQKTVAVSNPIQNNPIKKTLEPLKEITALPVVYANSTPIDSKAVFSIPSDNVKLTFSGKPKKEVLGFFPYWMTDQIDKIDFSSLTSISIFGLETNGKGEIVTSGEGGKTDPGWAMWHDEIMDKLIKKARLNNLKIYLTIKSFNNANIENLSNSDDAQKAFVANISYLVSSKNIDGVNIDFESSPTINDKVREGFTRLIKNLRVELKRQNPNSILTIDTYLSSGSEQGLFNLPALSAYTDAFIIMGYDMHTALGEPGPVAAMGGATNVIGYVQNYLEKIPEDKIILAVPYYGYDWSVNKDQAETKILPYAQIAEASKKTKLIWDENSQTPSYSYIENGTERIVHFDNVRSLGIKYDFINNKNLKGVGIWALGYDGLNSDLQKLLIDKFITE